MSGRRAKEIRRSDRNVKSVRVNENLKKDPLGQPELSARPNFTSTLSYTLVPTFPPDHPLYRKISNPLGSSGKYEATFVLAVPGYNVVQTEVNFEKLLEQGDSLLQVSSEVAKLNIQLLESPSSETALMNAEIGVNSFHRMQYIRFQLDADSFVHATKLAHDIAMPVLSRWSFQHDIPITISAVELHELASESRKWTLTVIGATKGFSDYGGASTEDGRTLLAAYREGMSTLEPLYQALCMFRVIEGCYVLRSRRQTHAIEQTKSFHDPGERLSLDQITTKNMRWRQDLETAFKPYSGKKFTQLRDDFRQSIRNAIAHLDPGSNPLAVDNYEDLLKVQQALPVMHHMARVLLTAELSPDDP